VRRDFRCRSRVWPGAKSLLVASRAKSLPFLHKPPSSLEIWLHRRPAGRRTGSWSVIADRGLAHENVKGIRFRRETSAKLPRPSVLGSAAARRGYASVYTLDARPPR
jgi:hypothetical protein